jgi:hypothetical protein
MMSPTTAKATRDGEAGSFTARKRSLFLPVPGPATPIRGRAKLSHHWLRRHLFCTQDSNDHVREPGRVCETGWWGCLSMPRSPPACTALSGRARNICGFVHQLHAACAMAAELATILILSSLKSWRSRLQQRKPKCYVLIFHFLVADNVNGRAGLRTNW